MSISQIAREGHKSAITITSQQGSNIGTIRVHTGCSAFFATLFGQAVNLITNDKRKLTVNKKSLQEYLISTAKLSDTSNLRLRSTVQQIFRKTALQEHGQAREAKSVCYGKLLEEYSNNLASDTKNDNTLLNALEQVLKKKGDTPIDSTSSTSPSTTNVSKEKSIDKSPILDKIQRKAKKQNLNTACKEDDQLVAIFFNLYQVFKTTPPSKEALLQKPLIKESLEEKKEHLKKISFLNTAMKMIKLEDWKEKEQTNNDSIKAMEESLKIKNCEKTSLQNELDESNIKINNLATSIEKKIDEKFRLRTQANDIRTNSEQDITQNPNSYKTSTNKNFWEQIETVAKRAGETVTKGAKKLGEKVTGGIKETRQGKNQLRDHLPKIVEEQENVKTTLLRASQDPAQQNTKNSVEEQLKAVEEQINTIDSEIETLTNQDKKNQDKKMALEVRITSIEKEIQALETQKNSLEDKYKNDREEYAQNLIDKLKQSLDAMCYIKDELASLERADDKLEALSLLKAKINHTKNLNLNYCYEHDKLLERENFNSLFYKYYNSIENPKLLENLTLSPILLLSDRIDESIFVINFSEPNLDNIFRDHSAQFHRPASPTAATTSGRATPEV